MASVSIIIPVYNRKSICQSALDTLSHQTLSDIEFILIDDGSTDGTYEYLLEQTASDSRFKIMRQPQNIGPGAARNMAIPNATGRYIGFFDIDDKIPSDYFELLYKNAIDNDADIVFCSYNGLRHSKTGILPNNATKFDIIRNGALWDKLFAKQLIMDNGITCPVGLYCADNVFVFLAFYYAQRVFACDTPVYSYVLSPDSISIDTAKVTKRKRDIQTVCQMIIDFAHAHQFDDTYIDATYHFLNRTFNIYADDRLFLDDFNRVLHNLCPNRNRTLPRVRNASVFTKIRLKLLYLLHIINRQQYDLLKQVSVIRRSGLFDYNWYTEQYAITAEKDPLKHYLTIGWRCGYNPCELFDGNAYLHDNPDIVLYDICPLSHYVTRGHWSGRYVRMANKGTVK